MPSMLTFRRDGAQVPQRDISWVVKLAKGWEKIGIYYRGAEGEFTVARFVGKYSKEMEVVGF